MSWFHKLSTDIYKLCRGRALLVAAVAAETRGLLLECLPHRLSHCHQQCQDAKHWLGINFTPSRVIRKSLEFYFRTSRLPFCGVDSVENSRMRWLLSKYILQFTQALLDGPIPRAPITSVPLSSLAALRNYLIVNMFFITRIYDINRKRKDQDAEYI